MASRGEKTALYDLTYDELADLLASWGEPRFRVNQLWRWLYRSLAGDWESMTNLPSRLRERLEAETDLELVTPIAMEESLTGQTHKVLFELRDGTTIESVLMDYDDRTTVCISTQVGCGMGCTFCATGQGGLLRNLSAGEVVAQVLYFARELRKEEIAQANEVGEEANLPAHPVDNVVLMGMGESLANYDATWQAIETLADDRGYNLGARHITLSTVGLVPGIRRLADEGLPINLAVSLHAPDDELRSRLVPVNRRYPIAELMSAIREYIDATGRRVTFEYALIAGVNDSLERARALAHLLDGVLAHVNLIPLNPTHGSDLEPSPREQVDAFRQVLQAAGIATTVRMRRGIDIEAGCGQLRSRYWDK
ncbi:MAG: 23S rRNA (adenine(2503)-C(2))-methyltransferase RlmN [Anaerolineae bacterium]|nr:23S rRNA (adenine(2503)-C(2))-methyltransferase RlmN [Anaerolineae bacterium]